MITKRTSGLVKKPKYRIRVFKQLTLKAQPQSQQWRWHLQSLVGTRPLLCTSGEAFYNRANACRAARRMAKLLTVPVDFVFEVA